MSRGSTAAPTDRTRRPSVSEEGCAEQQTVPTAVNRAECGSSAPAAPSRPPPPSARWPCSAADVAHRAGERAARGRLRGTAGSRGPGVRRARRRARRRCPSGPRCSRTPGWSRGTFPARSPAGAGRGRRTASGPASRPATGYAACGRRRPRARHRASSGERNDLDRVVVVDVSSTEPPVDEDPAPTSLPALEQALAAGRFPLPASSLYAYAAFRAGCAVRRLHPQPRSAACRRSVSWPWRDGLPWAGSDGKTGETLRQGGAGADVRDAGRCTCAPGSSDQHARRRRRRAPWPTRRPRPSKTRSKGRGLDAILGYDGRRAPAHRLRRRTWATGRPPGTTSPSRASSAYDVDAVHLGGLRLRPGGAAGARPRAARRRAHSRPGESGPLTALGFFFKDPAGSASTGCSAQWDALTRGAPRWGAPHEPHDGLALSSTTCARPGRAGPAAGGAHRAGRLARRRGRGGLAARPPDTGADAVGLGLPVLGRDGAQRLRRPRPRRRRASRAPDPVRPGPPAPALGVAAGLTAAGVGIAAAAGGRRSLAVAVPLAATVWAYDLVAQVHPGRSGRDGGRPRPRRAPRRRRGPLRRPRPPALTVGAAHASGSPSLSRGEVHGSKPRHSAAAALAGTAAAAAGGLALGGPGGVGTPCTPSPPRRWPAPTPGLVGRAQARRRTRPRRATRCARPPAPASAAWSRCRRRWPRGPASVPAAVGAACRSRAGRARRGAPKVVSARRDGLRFGYGTNGFVSHRLDDALGVIADLGYDGVALTLDQPHLDPFADDLPRGPPRSAVASTRSGSRSSSRPAPATCSTRGASTSRRSCPSDGRDAPGRLPAARGPRRGRPRCRGGVVLVGHAARRHAGRRRLGAAGLPASRRCSRRPSGARVACAFEPEPGMFVDRLDGVLELRRRLGDPPTWPVTLDVGHCVCNEDRAGRRVHPPAGDLIANVQIDDMRRDVHEHLEFGDGEVDFPPRHGGAARRGLPRAGGGGAAAARRTRRRSVAERSLASCRQALRGGATTAGTDRRSAARVRDERPATRCRAPVEAALDSTARARLLDMASEVRDRRASASATLLPASAQVGRGPLDPADEQGLLGRTRGRRRARVLLAALGEAWPTTGTTSSPSSSDSTATATPPSAGACCATCTVLDLGERGAAAGRTTRCAPTTCGSSPRRSGPYGGRRSLDDDDVPPGRAQVRCSSASRSPRSTARASAPTPTGRDARGLRPRAGRRRRDVPADVWLVVDRFPEQLDVLAASTAELDSPVPARRAAAERALAGRTGPAAQLEGELRCASSTRTST